MGLLDGFKGWLVDHQVQARSAAPFNVAGEYPTLQAQISAFRTGGYRGPWRQPSIHDALGVPGIQRCVTLISNTTGSLSIQGFRNGAAMTKAPPLIARPDPYCTPRDFYRDSSFNMATRGEVVWWIAKRDPDESASALVVVPLRELKIEANERNRLLPDYIWGTIKGTRWSPANPSGQFVHVTYLKEPGELRGVGPLQLGQAAVSVSVEAQEWAANFYATGGPSSVELHTDEDLSDEESRDLKSQWTANPPNTPQVTTGDMEVRDHEVNPQGAQMLDARAHQDGDAARMFGVAGALLEYSAPGSSLTYQNITEVFTLFVKTCLAVNYLEPIEQALSDLLTRSTVARFNVEGFLRADIKTRFEVYGAAVGLWGQEDAAQWAREQEGRAPGNVEFAPVPFAPPQAVITSIPQARTEMEVRCDGMARKRRAGIMSLERCNALLAPAGGTFVGSCRRCKKVYAAA